MKSLSYYDENGTVYYSQNQIMDLAAGSHRVLSSVFTNYTQPNVITTSYNNQTFPFFYGKYFEMLVSLYPNCWEVIFFVVFDLSKFFIIKLIF